LRHEHEDTFGEGLGFAIPAESVRFFLDHATRSLLDDNPSNAYRYLEPPAARITLRRRKTGSAEG